MSSWLYRLIANHCTLCGQTLPSHERLCNPCLADLPYLSDRPIHLSSIASTVSSGNVQINQQADALFDYIYCEFAYQWPIDQMVTRLKFGHKLIYATILGQQLAKGLQHNNITLPDCILPMPLHTKRLRSRGFNQAHEIAKVTGKYLHIPLIHDYVARSVYTQAQSDLRFEERQHNIHQVFSIQKALPYQHIAILDDVITTGSTILELAQLLKSQGITTVSLWACAHARLDNS